MRLVEGRHVRVGEEGLRKLPQEGLDEGGHIVGRGVPEGGVSGARGGVEVGVQRPPQLLDLGPGGGRQRAVRKRLLEGALVNYHDEKPFQNSRNIIMKVYIFF